MQTIFLLATAFTVSVDSFLCGLSLQAQYKGNFRMLIGIMLSVFLLCFIGSVSGYVVGDFLQNYSNLLGGVILYGVSILNTQPEKQSKTIITNANGHIFKKSIAVGIGVGLDGALACFSLSIARFNAIMVTMLITVTHALTLTIAINLINVFTDKNHLIFEKVPPLILAILGSIKTASFFQ